MLTFNHRHHHSHMAPSLPPLFSTFLITLLLFSSAFADSNNDSPPPTPTPTPTPIPSQQHYTTTFKPGIAIIIAVLTLFFSLTFILLLYIKHCTGNTIATTAGGGILLSSSSRDFPPSTRKNSGINRSIVESLPIFRFGSLTGQKDGLDCAVCLNKFDAVDVLRLLPKCKHAFHVECVDTWLEAHSTCPLCRYRVDPEDILLVVEDNSNNTKKSFSHQDSSDIEKGRVSVTIPVPESKRRHSSVGEKEWERSKTASFRWSLDSRKKNEVVGIGCFVRPLRKDGMLLTKEKEERISVERRLEHRIIVSPSMSGVHRDQRWSDVQPCDLLYLTSEMIISEARGGGYRKKEEQRNNNDERWKSGRGIINSRSVSEITGLSRFSSNSNNNSNNNNSNSNCREREEGLVSRWLAWISNSHSQPDVR